METSSGSRVQVPDFEEIEAISESERSGFDGAADLKEIYQDVAKYDLQANIAELEAFGYTVVPPEKAAPPAFQERLREAMIEMHARHTGHRINDVTTDSTGTDGPLAAYWSLLTEDRAFEEALLNPVVYTLARYMCGKSVLLSDMVGLLKNQDDTPTHRLHIDQFGTPPPLPPYPQVANVTWTLTDYTIENGPLAIVPGSHRFGRPPRDYEEDFLAENAPVKAVPVEAPAGSIIAFSGTTWHASFPRRAPGVRLTLVMAICRSYMRQIRDFRRECPQEILDRNPPEFADMLGINAAYPYPENASGPDLKARARFIAAGHNQWA